ncbi:repressible alkaline phosphatase precursor [Fusarium circinatum]|uniref:Repressible alkaline phosphatase n=1 Tax=Fusarium circinatum TaxID=48490 RepID=A0A8H5UHH8_FUSCI|nr:repressible alkaline phosphatase precursor [Fusarium circinatum]
MSGAEVLGIISGVITVVEATITLYKTAKDSSGLPPSLRDAASRLPLIQESLTVAAHGIQRDAQPSPEPYAALGAVLQACSDKATQLHHIFESMVPPSGATRTHRYLRAAKSFPQVEKVNVLVEGILGDLQVLTLNHVVKTATREQIQKLMRGRTRQTTGTESPVVLNNTGTGRQYAHTGQGDQNVASDAATQVNGTFHGGVFNFTQA